MNRLDFDIRKFRRMTAKKAVIAILCILFAMAFFALDYKMDLGLGLVGIVVVSGVFGATPGVIAVLLSSILTGVIFGGAFDLCDACTTQIIAAVVAYLTRKGFMRCKSRALTVFLFTAFIRNIGYFVGIVTQELSEGKVSFTVLFDPGIFIHGLRLFIPVLVLYLAVRFIPDRYLLFLPNLHIYLRDEEVRRIVCAQEIIGMKHTLVGRVSLVIAGVASVMTITAIFLFNALYYKPEMIRSDLRRTVYSAKAVNNAMNGDDASETDPGTTPENPEAQAKTKAENDPDREPTSKEEAVEAAKDTLESFEELAGALRKMADEAETAVESLEEQNAEENGDVTDELDSNTVLIDVDGKTVEVEELLDRVEGSMQLAGWNTRAGIAKNVAFFIKFVMGLIYVEIVAIAIAVGYVRRTMTGPVEAIAFAMNTYAAGTEEERIECGNYIHGLNIRTGDELEALYAAFEKMVDDFGDYVERLQKENELKRDLEVERASNNAKSAFLSNMSHELRTPITAVLGMDEMILRESNDDNIKGYAGDIQNAGRTLLGIVNDILDFSKIEAGKLEIIPVDYELASVINDLVNMIRVRADDKKLELILRINENIPHLLHGDEIRLKQIITNILTNAVKYTEEGSITLTMDYEKTGDSELELYVSVKDTGIGIKEEDQEKLFKAFERIEEKRNRTIEGTGLGMNITQSLLSMMGSSLEVNSVYGEGSEFSFKLKQGIVKDDPIGNIEETYKKTMEQREKYRESFHAPEARILVVDDTEMNLSVIKNLLKQTKIQVDTAKSGFECLKLVALTGYDIIFLDHRMPEMDGMETFEKMKELGEDENKCKDKPVIALTANAISGAREEYLKAGFNDYLTKPVDSEKLEKMLLKYLPPEKIMPAEPEPEEESLFPDSDLPEWLLKLKEIDKEEGMMNCGSSEYYIIALGLFYDNFRENYDNIKRYFEEGNRKDYNIKVHSLKSSARLIGAKELSELARTLEEASNEDSYDEGYIKEKTPVLLSMYESLFEKLSPVKEEGVMDDSINKALL
ncbi:MAG: response regulator [Lachnospiraceae bacterium]|nr:response regulator [Lachnospiraceae bacterium]